MTAMLTDKQKKKIIADYLELGSYNATGKKNSVSNHTVKRVVSEVPELTEKIKQKKEENTADVLAYMETQRGIVCEIIGKGLSVLNSDEKLAEATPAQITTAIGTLIDKWAPISGMAKDTDEEDGLSRSLRELAEELDKEMEDTENGR